MDNQQSKSLVAATIANFLLIANKKKLPVKKTELQKLIPLELKRDKSLLAIAAKHLDNVFGYKLVEIDKKDCYILVNMLEDNDFELETPDTFNTKDSANHFLKTTFLIAIFMNGGVMQEGQARQFLKALVVDLDSKRKSQLYGDVNKYILMDLPRQRYLDVKEQKELDPPTKEFRWGPRASLEMNKLKILKHVCQIYGSSLEPKHWPEQYKQIIEEENQQ